MLRVIAERKEIVKVVESRYKAKEIDGINAVLMLQAYGIPNDQAELLVAQWESREQAKGKEFGASELCTYFGQGLINGDQYFQRLMRVGWSADDAKLIVSSCGIKISERLAKEAQKKQKQRTPGSKTLNPSQLCKANTDGLIDDTQYMDAMRSLGYSDDDANTLLQECKIAASSKKKPKGP
jgi:hypothetical protein